jgi:peptidoglycan/xylan/chitin deacetylase (PgdA/CDA1 family)
MRYILSALLILALGCTDDHHQKISAVYAAESPQQPADTTQCCVYNASYTDTFSGKKDDPEVEGEIPILCYHQVRDWTNADSKAQREYIMPIATFKEQIKTLQEYGYHAILPDQLMDYLEKGIKLPSNPVMLTFDDADESQYTNGLPELNKAGFKGVFFVMTVVLNHPRYFTKERVKELFAQGHTIGCHTWDHHSVTRYQADDWVKQVAKPKEDLEKITGAPVKYFAYPNGLWNQDAVVQLKKYSFTAAFQLAGKPDKKEPLYTIRRVIADPHWTKATLLQAIKRDFKEKWAYTKN